MYSAVAPTVELIKENHRQTGENTSTKESEEPNSSKSEETEESCDPCNSNKQEEHTSAETCNARPQEKPKNMSQHLWEKFQALHKRREEIANKSAQRRIRELQKKVTKNVQEEFSSNPEDLEVLEKHLPNTVKRKRPHSSNQAETTSERDSIQCQWGGIKQYLHVNDHLTGGDKSTAKQKTKIASAIDDAIEIGDVETAEKLSDHLAVREFGTKIASAIRARDFVEAKKVEQEKEKEKPKKKLGWGFDHKQRWETKGNM